MTSRLEQYQKYEELTQKLGAMKLRHIVMRVLGLCCHADPVEFVKEHLDSVPLEKWKAHAPLVRGLIHKGKAGIVPEAECVCLLKHVAVYHVAKELAPELEKSDGS